MLFPHHSPKPHLLYSAFSSLLEEGEHLHQDLPGILAPKGMFDKVLLPIVFHHYFLGMIFLQCYLVPALWVVMQWTMFDSSMKKKKKTMHAYLSLGVVRLQLPEETQPER